MTDHSLPQKRQALIADWDRLIRTFNMPEIDGAEPRLTKYMNQILFGLNDFLQRHVGITEEVRLKTLSTEFSDSLIHQNPEKKLADVLTDLIDHIAPHAVNVSSPYFVGHMTSAIPFFMVHLKTIVAALNQNVVKLETSKVCSLVEKQVLAKIHRLIYDKGQQFYDYHIQNAQTTLGCFVEDGTLANLTAMWVARNSLFGPKERFTGIESEGIAAAYQFYDVDRSVIIVSRLAHYSLKKAGGILGIGNDNIISINLDDHNRMDLNCLKRTLRQLDSNSKKTKIIAIVGIAGTTETGTIDPLTDLAQICAERQIHFHVDAAWGGPTLMSARYRSLLKGIELADSVTIDGHKQFYMPMTCGMVYFKNPSQPDAIAYHANYVNRVGSVDLGIKSLSGSREANSLILNSALKIMGIRGYGLLIEHGIETARQLAAEIDRRENFELTTPPELNILTYRIVPVHIRRQFDSADMATKKNINIKLNKINRAIQIIQRETGNSFVSRTTLIQNNNPEQNIVVLRCVIMNPMVSMKILNEILDEQEKIYRNTFGTW
ncbi:MAG: putative pyridoxal-dependent aspartate 1-decarboxylase [Desulfobacterales bacterium]|nr:putative pyridoxal-dependent aspartate 1-decarboxylase [Desulfobacterales bacterium]MDD4071047.1 putative pyridoxal-dependent aspartate 1-decarboxylase [Desulfobacterales bacterium]MDD4392444.1 putative pyridoxal-dependent aspartate 1-decarboxylase [Desulfobacterales bacterium]